MDFIMGLPKIAKEHDGIMVLVDKLSKVAHFVAIKSTHTRSDIDKIFMKEVSLLHVVTKKSILDQDAS